LPPGIHVWIATFHRNYLNREKKQQQFEDEGVSGSRQWREVLKERKEQAFPRLQPAGTLP
jgi:hypothetical protein